MHFLWLPCVLHVYPFHFYEILCNIFTFTIIDKYIMHVVHESASLLIGSVLARSLDFPDSSSKCSNVPQGVTYTIQRLLTFYFTKLGLIFMKFGK
jgi:hypothetical protein